MSKNDPDKPVVVYSGSLSRALLLKTFLDDNQIPAIVQDFDSAMLLPYSNSPGGIGGVKVLVRSKDLDRAKVLVKEFLQGSENQ